MKPCAVLLLSCLLLSILGTKQDVPPHDFLGESVNKIGDINGDGYDDIVIGAPSHCPMFQGAVYIVYGRATSNLCDIDLHTMRLDPATTGFIILGGSLTFIGTFVSSAGDINGDGYDDIVISGLEKLYIIYGGPSSSLANINLSETVFDPAINGFTITYGSTNGMLYSLAKAGDVNGDGYDDIVFSLREVITNEGKVYIIYGGKSAELSNIDLAKAALDPATNGFTVYGEKDLGISVNGAGDIDQDGYDDITFVGVDGDAAVAYVIYGGPKSRLSNINLRLTILNPAENGFTILGTSGHWSSASVSNFGDVNGDGYPDFIFGFPGELDAGRVYVIYGRPRSSLANIDLTQTSLDPAKTGFNITGNIFKDDFSSGFGHDVSIVGDINQDGYHDVLIGAPSMSDEQEPSDRGKSYVVYGGPTASLRNIDLRTSILDPTSTGFTINGNAFADRLGTRVSSAGDMNKDGYDDIIVAAPFKSDERGAVYIIYGGPKSNRLNIDLSKTALDPAKTGFTILGDFIASIPQVQSIQQ